MKKIILVTGSAGFIGYSVCNKLLREKNIVIGIDNFNSYYSPKLKKNRINDLKKKYQKNFYFFRVDIVDKKKLYKCLKKFKVQEIIHLAAQAGVRYSFQNPDAYFKSNINGFYNIICLSRDLKISHLIFASSSSVYGEAQKFPLKEDYNTSKPIQFYAATKKSNEVFAHAFSKIYKIKMTCIRFFTVYGPWGRPDMALYNFVDKISKNKKIDVFNHGQHERDFTYIDDIVDGIYLILRKKYKRENFEIFNLANGKKVKLMDYIKEIEDNLNKKAKIIFKRKQIGDVHITHGSVDKAKKKLGYKPNISYKIGIKKFIKWYKDYYSI